MDCHRVVTKPSNADFGRTAFVVDDVWPEFDSYIQETRSEKDQLFLPIDGRRYRKPNYGWTTSGFHSISQSFLTAAIRSYRSRKLAQQGAARQRNLLAMYERLAEGYARRLKYDVLHVVVQQNLLPFLWRDGHLGGRTFDVLMTALPMNELQGTLDDAAKLHPESTTLGDFRAEKWLVDAESEALQHAAKVITPHSYIASFFEGRAVLVPWKMPEAIKRDPIENDKPVLLFPASTVGRKGCYELRDAIRGLELKLLTMGPYIEATDFWKGFDIERAEQNGSLNADAVVLPAFVEHKPRRLLAAAAGGIPVIATENCGIGNVAGVKAIRAGNVDELRSAILNVLAKLSPKGPVHSSLV
jgi:hypothetical protein